MLNKGKKQGCIETLNSAHLPQLPTDAFRGKRERERAEGGVKARNEPGEGSTTNSEKKPRIRPSVETSSFSPMEGGGVHSSSCPPRVRSNPLAADGWAVARQK
ncbi:hypothetical protein LY76DRAFT_415202 [Colletotrichum caudatum]|nr:hypothetical protein LY76DRAFT_415202 [Colletotrichum caudatum]